MAAWWELVARLLMRGVVPDVGSTIGGGACIFVLYESESYRRATPLPRVTAADRVFFLAASLAPGYRHRFIASNTNNRLHVKQRGTFAAISKQSQKQCTEASIEAARVCSRECAGCEMSTRTSSTSGVANKPLPKNRLYSLYPRNPGI